jgi:hypothetical protein
MAHRLCPRVHACPEITALNRSVLSCTFAPFRCTHKSNFAWLSNRTLGYPHCTAPRNRPRLSFGPSPCRDLSGCTDRVVAKAKNSESGPSFSLDARHIQDVSKFQKASFSLTRAVLTRPVAAPGAAGTTNPGWHHRDSGRPFRKRHSRGRGERPHRKTPSWSAPRRATLKAPTHSTTSRSANTP